MGGDHLGHLLLDKYLLEVRGGGEVPGLAISFGERFVGDVTDKVLEKGVLAAVW